MSNKSKIPLLCRLFGHRWKPSHVLARLEVTGLNGWVYCGDMCRRCRRQENRMTEWAKARDEYSRILKRFT